MFDGIDIQRVAAATIGAPILALAAILSASAPAGAAAPAPAPCAGKMIFIAN